MPQYGPTEQYDLHMLKKICGEAMLARFELLDAVPAYVFVNSKLGEVDNFDYSRPWVVWCLKTTHYLQDNHKIHQYFTLEEALQALITHRGNGNDT